MCITCVSKARGCCQSANLCRANPVQAQSGRAEASKAKVLISPASRKARGCCRGRPCCVCCATCKATAAHVRPAAGWGECHRCALPASAARWPLSPCLGNLRTRQKRGVRGYGLMHTINRVANAHRQPLLPIGPCHAPGLKGCTLMYIANRS